MGSKLSIPIHHYGGRERAEDPDVSDEEEEHNNSDAENMDSRLDTVTTPNPSPNASSWKTPDGIPKLEVLKSQQILALIDPRSPNQDISRTPIVFSDEQKKSSHLLKVSQGINQANSNGGSEFTTPEAQGPPVLAFDPRSPTHEFNRTPIGISQKKETYRHKPSKFEINKHLQLPAGES